MNRKVREILYRLVTGVLIGLIFGTAMLGIIYIGSGILSLLFGGLQ